MPKESLRFPGDYNLSKGQVEIITATGEILPLRMGTIIELNIFEDIEVSALTGSMVIVDSSNIITVFRNGSAYGSSVTNANSGTYNSIGKFKSTSFLNSSLDEVAIFNTDQTANVSTIYNSGVPGDLSSLSPLHWYRFEEGSGTTATDSGTGGNNGTISGATYSTDVPT